MAVSIRLSDYTRLGTQSRVYRGRVSALRWAQASGVVFSWLPGGTDRLGEGSVTTPGGGNKRRCLAEKSGHSPMWKRRIYPFSEGPEGQPLSGELAYPEEQ